MYRKLLTQHQWYTLQWAIKNKGLGEKLSETDGIEISKAKLVWSSEDKEI